MDKRGRPNEDAGPLGQLREPPEFDFDALGRPGGRGGAATRTALDRPLLVGGAVILATAVLSGAVGWYLLGVEPRQDLTANLSWLVTIGAAVTSAHLLTRQHRLRARRIAFGVLVAAGLAVGYLPNALLEVAQSTHVQLRAQVTGLHLPDGVTLTSFRQPGDRLCHLGCPELDYIYRVPAGTDRTQAYAVFDRAFYAVGFRFNTDEPDMLFRGRYEADVEPTGDIVAVRVYESHSQRPTLNGRPGPS